MRNVEAILHVRFGELSRTCRKSPPGLAASVEDRVGAAAEATRPSPVDAVDATEGVEECARIARIAWGRAGREDGWRGMGRRSRPRESESAAPRGRLPRLAIAARAGNVDAVRATKPSPRGRTGGTLAASSDIFSACVENGEEEGVGDERAEGRDAPSGGLFRATSLAGATDEGMAGRRTGRRSALEGQRGVLPGGGRRGIRPGVLRRAKWRRGFRNAGASGAVRPARAWEG